MVWVAAAMAGASLLSGIGSAQSASSQNRKAMRAFIDVEEHNRRVQDQVNLQNRELGQSIIDNPERYAESTDNKSLSVTTIDLAGMRRAAEASGFNPVSVLRSGGLAGFMTTTSSQSQRSTAGLSQFAVSLMSPQAYFTGAPPQMGRVPSGLEIAGNALGAGVGAYSDQQTRLQDQAFQRSLLETQLGAQAKTSSGFASALSSGFAGQTAALSSAYRNLWERGGVTVTNPHPNARVEASSADADAYSARYGEPGEWIFGVRNMIDDSMLNLTGRTKDERYDASRKVWDSFMGGLLRNNPNPGWSTGGSF